MIDNTANNLANVNTHGFRRSHMDFADLAYNTIQQPGRDISTGLVSPTGLQIGNGVRVVSTTKHFTQGNMEQTGNPLDVGIEGDGFFRVQLPSGDFGYTRAGSFRKDPQGLLVNADGYAVDGGVSIGADAQNLSIGIDGSVQGELNGINTTFGTIPLFTFANPAGLSSEGANLFRETAASGTAAQAIPGQSGAGILRGNFLESSNVEVVTELISLIAAQRAYEINSRAIRAGDEMLSTATDIVR
jgi:flagellar basal-body rod protein FlgG